jgi:hypothetical protein
VVEAPACEKQGVLLWHVAGCLVVDIYRKGNYMLDFGVGTNNVKEGVFKCNEIGRVQKLVSASCEFALGDFFFEGLADSHLSNI